MNAPLHIRRYSFSGNGVIESTEEDVQSFLDATAYRNGRTFSVMNVLEHDLERFPPIKYHIDRLVINRGIFLIAGHPKHGKSMLRAHIAACTALGAPFFGHNTQQGDVLILAAEDTVAAEHIHIERIANAMGYSRADYSDRIHHVLNRDVRLDDKTDMAILFGIVKDLEPAVVFIDPLIRFHDCKESEATDMQKVIRPLSILGDSTLVGIMHHFDKKGKTPRGTGDLLGSYTSKWEVRALGEGILSSITIEPILKIGAVESRFRVGYRFHDDVSEIELVQHTNTKAGKTTDYEARLLETVARSPRLPNKEAVLNVTTGRKAALGEAFDQLLRQERITVDETGVMLNE
jgi:hypothetical protein